MDEDELARLLQIQDGVVSRRQLRSLKAADHDIRNLVRRRDLVRVHPGVFVNHTGEPTWEQRAWAAVHVHWPAALTRESALPSPAKSAPIQVAIDVRRTLVAVPGVRAHRTPGFDARVLWIKSPPRVGLEHALIDPIDMAVSKTDPLEAFRVFADGCQTKQTSAGAVAAVLRARPRVRGKPLGGCSSSWVTLSPGPAPSSSASISDRSSAATVFREGGARTRRARTGGRSIAMWTTRTSR